MEKKYIFLLGGYDLEMVTIKEMLESQGEMFFDGELTAGLLTSRLFSFIFY